MLEMLEINKMWVEVSLSSQEIIDKKHILNSQEKSQYSGSKSNNFSKGNRLFRKSCLYLK